jgi:type II secretory pathway pseudopilin PulG
MDRGYSIIELIVAIAVLITGLAMTCRVITDSIREDVFARARIESADIAAAMAQKASLLGSGALPIEESWPGRSREISFTSSCVLQKPVEGSEHLSRVDIEVTWSRGSMGATHHYPLVLRSE